jgi:beta-1,6-galactosyltransferase
MLSCSCFVLVLLLFALLCCANANEDFLYHGRLVLARDDPQLKQLVRDPSEAVPSSRWRPMLPSKDTVTHKRYATCAIVGSSGAVLKQRQGAAIDRSELIVRFNLAPTRNFEPFVGTRTTWRFVNDPLWLRTYLHLSQEDRGRIFTQCVSSNGFFKFSTNLSNNTAAAPRQKLFDECIHPRFYEHVASFMPKPSRQQQHNSLFADQRPTTGLVAVLMLINICDSVAVFGFDHRNESYHYWQSGRTKRIGVHQWSFEAALLRKMQALRLLFVKKP